MKDEPHLQEETPETYAINPELLEAEISDFDDPMNPEKDEFDAL